MDCKELAVYFMAIDKLLEHDLIKDAREVLQFAIAQAPQQKQNSDNENKFMLCLMLLFE